MVCGLHHNVTTFTTSTFWNGLQGLCTMTWEQGKSAMTRRRSWTCVARQIKETTSFRQLQLTRIENCVFHFSFWHAQQQTTLQLVRWNKGMQKRYIDDEEEDPLFQFPLALWLWQIQHLTWIKATLQLCSILGSKMTMERAKTRKFSGFQLLTKWCAPVCKMKRCFAQKDLVRTSADLLSGIPTSPSQELPNPHWINLIESESACCPYVFRPRQ